MKVSLAQRELNFTSKVFSPLAMLVKHNHSSSCYMSRNKKAQRLWNGFWSNVREGDRGSKGGAELSQAVHEAWPIICVTGSAAGLAWVLQETNECLYGGKDKGKGVHHFLCFRLSTFHYRLQPVALTVKLLDTTLCDTTGTCGVYLQPKSRVWKVSCGPLCG